MPERLVVDPDLDFIRDLQKAGGSSVKKCYQCATCGVVCEMSPDKAAFPRKEMLWAQWGQKEKLISDPDVWLCHQCNDCSDHCPRDARPGDVLAAVRAYVYRSFAFPAFMGKALASPAGLPGLFLLPLLIVASIMWLTTGGDFAFLNDPDIEYSKILAHGWLEGLFMLGNVIIFAFAAVGLWRFWNTLRLEPETTVTMSFVSAFISTLLAILTHKNFATCTQNKPRQTAHLLVMYGFLGAAVTAGLAVLWTVILGHHGPINLDNPIKMLGAASGMAIFIGSTMMILRRNNSNRYLGAEGYADRLFLWMIFFVGLTGMLSWLIRLTGIPVAAYSTYFIHIVLVFFLLWYMPYSKFAHMLYRTLALIWAQQRGRELVVRDTKEMKNYQEASVV